MSQVSGDHFSKDAREFERKKYALVVGVNQSTNMPKVLPSLHYAESDAAGISYLLGREACNFAFPSGYLIGTAASTQNVRKAMGYLIDDKSENDLLLFYFTGHSYPIMTVEGRVKTYLVTSDFDPHKAKDIPGAHLSLEEIREILYTQQTMASVICILDCSYAGAIVEPAPPEQLTQSLQAFTKDIANTTQAPASSRRTWVILASTGPEGMAYEREGHALMTSLIIDMLNGEIPDALDHDGNLTLLTLYHYLQHTLGPKGQDPIMHGRFGSLPWVLAQHPSKNRVVRKPEEHPEPSQPSLSSLHPPSDMSPSNPRHVWETSYPLSSLHPPFDMSPSPAVFADLDPQQVRKFLKKKLVQLQRDYRADLSEQDQMEALSLLRGEHPSYGALLCFGHNPSHQIVGAYTRCVYWSDRERLSGWIDDRECRGSLLEQFTQACNFLRNHLHFSRIIDRGRSSERPEIPFRALEEAVANALVHREYVTGSDRTVRTEGIQVEIFSDRVEITSPGGPPTKLDLKHPESHPRNVQIMRIFYLAGLVEMLGTGLMRMNQWMQEAGLPKPVIRADQQAFTVTLYRRAQSIHDSSSSDKNKKPLALPLAPRKSLPALVLVVAILALVVGLYFGGGLSLFIPHPMLPPSTTIEIASDFPTSGLDATVGSPLQNGVQMAITEANNEHLLSGYTLKLIPFDDVGSGNRDDPQVGAKNINQAITNNLVAGVIGPYNSSVALQELPLANRAPLALLSPSATFSCLTKSSANYPYCTGINDIAAQMRPTNQLTFFRLVTTDDRQGKVTADYFFQTKHYSRVLLLNDDSDPYSLDLAQAFQTEWQNMGGQVTSVNLPQPISSIQNYQNTLQTVASFQPDLIYFAGDDPNGSYVLQALSNIPSLKTVPFAGADSIVDSSLLQTAASFHQNAPIYVSLPIEDPAHARTSIGSDFTTNYAANGYNNYRPYAATAYDCTMMLIQAIKAALQKGISTPHGIQDHAGAMQFRQAILQALQQLSYTGATGIHRFDANGDTTNQTISFYQADLSTPQPSWKWLK